MYQSPVANCTEVTHVVRRQPASRWCVSSATSESCVSTASTHPPANTGSSALPPRVRGRVELPHRNPVTPLHQADRARAIENTRLVRLTQSSNSLR